jgi:hypothetical protein
VVVEARVGELAIVTNGGSGYLVVEILGTADTFDKAQEILDAELEEGEDDEEGEDEDFEDDDEE